MKNKRMNTASEVMIEDFAALKERGISDFICTVSTSTKKYKPVLRHTAQGVSSYANLMYSKYGDDTSVNVGYFDDNLNWFDYCTYHA
ncbi:MAG: hypothetical protein E7510_10420 [Ruminococcus sp.]|nr:hypothetical protein [Ruminococcus sp.]